MGVGTKNWFLRNRPFLVYPPLATVMLAYALLSATVTPVAVVGLYFVGAASWTLLEWLLHRAMHLPTGIDWISQLQYSAHLRHHREPDDLEHCVVRLRNGIPITIVLLFATRMVLGDWESATAFLSGLLTGYLFYEFVHLTGHAGRRLPALRFLQRYHTLHHFEQWNRCFGVTSPLWDWVFGTAPRRRKAQRSAAPVPSIAK